MAEQRAQELPANEKFFRYFQHEVTDLQNLMECLGTRATSGGERADAVDHVLAGIARLSNEVKNASSYIPAYDQRTYGDTIKALSNKLQDIRTTFAPRPKFSFKSGKSGTASTAKKNASVISSNAAAERASEGRRQGPGIFPHVSDDSGFATIPVELHSPALKSASDQGVQEGSGDVEAPSSVTIGNHDGMHIILPASENHATTSGTLSMLHRCVIDMNTPTKTDQAFAGLTLKNIRESLIICGHVNGAAHLTNISNSIIVVASRQFRMHESRNCDVYLLTTSRPIIEDCSGIRFAPLPDIYTTDSDRKTENQWQQVDDFKWLRSEPSPNWRVLAQDDWIKPEIWTNIVPGGPSLGTEDVLEAVILPK